MPAEHNVDLEVFDAFFKDRGSQGVLVEVGAADPEFLSVSASFRKRGWKIIAVEPNPEFCRLHRERGHAVHEFACSHVDEDDVDFFIVSSVGQVYHGVPLSFESFSSLGMKDEFLDHYKTAADGREIFRVKVKSRRLDTILQTYEPDTKEIDVLSIDVEGWELNVLAGLSIDTYRPKVVIMENLFHRQDQRDYLLSRGYVLWKTLAPNEVFVRVATGG
jgi:FkbM family methyltransferase